MLTISVLSVCCVLLVVVSYVVCEIKLRKLEKNIDNLISRIDSVVYEDDRSRKNTSSKKTRVP